MSGAATPRAKPRGRDQTMAELLAAARTLFAERGFDAVSVRDISQLANVNHALVHRHFGTKENLLRAVMRAEAEKSLALIGDVDDPARAVHQLFAANAADPAFARILAYALLNRVRAREVLIADGALTRIAGALATDSAARIPSGRRSKRVERTARENTAIVAATALGWFIFEPFLTSAVGIDDDQLPATRDRVEESIDILLTRSLGPPDDTVGQAQRTKRRAGTA